MDESSAYDLGVQNSMESSVAGLNQGVVNHNEEVRQFYKGQFALDKKGHQLNQDILDAKDTFRSIQSSKAGLQVGANVVRAVREGDGTALGVAKTYATLVKPITGTIAKENFAYAKQTVSDYLDDGKGKASSAIEGGDISADAVGQRVAGGIADADAVGTGTSVLSSVKQGIVDGASAIGGGVSSAASALNTTTARMGLQGRSAQFAQLSEDGRTGGLNTEVPQGISTEPAPAPAPAPVEEVAPAEETAPAGEAAEGGGEAAEKIVPKVAATTAETAGDVALRLGKKAAAGIEIAGHVGSAAMAGYSLVKDIADPHGYDSLNSEQKKGNWMGILAGGLDIMSMAVPILAPVSIGFSIASAVEDTLGEHAKGGDLSGSQLKSDEQKESGQIESTQHVQSLSSQGLLASQAIDVNKQITGTSSF